MRLINEFNILNNNNKNDSKKNITFPYRFLNQFQCQFTIG